jgi:hypothetical protein
MQKKLYHFYHIYADGKWFAPVTEHLKALRKSGLQKNLEGFFIGITSSDKNRARIERFLKAYSFFFPFTYTIVNHSTTGWEQTTLDKLYEFSLDHEGYVLYAHTKGASNSHPINHYWRRSMIYFNIKNWKKATEKLKDHQAVGCHWLLPEDLPCNGYYFGGNFWWADFSLIRTLGKPLKNSRFDAEIWIGNKFETHPFAVYDLNPGIPATNIFKDYLTMKDRYVFLIKSLIKTRLAP